VNLKFRLILFLIFWLFSLQVGTIKNIGMSLYEDVPWYNNNWRYRQEIIIINNFHEPLINYQVHIQLNYTNFDFSKAQSDGSDLRFIYYNSTERTQRKISYWIEWYSSSKWTASIWVEVPYIPAEGNITIYLYYGNLNAKSESIFETTMQKMQEDEYTVALWHFDDDNGSIVSDSSKNHNNGRVYGGYGWDNDVRFSQGRSLTFNGSNYVVVSYSSSLDCTDALTIEAWIKPKILAPMTIIVKKSTPYWEQNYHLRIADNSGHLAFSFFIVGNGEAGPYISSGTIKAGSWNYIAVTVNFREQKVKLYINGTLDQEWSTRELTPQIGPFPLYIGGYFAYGTIYVPFLGSIDEIRISSRVLNADEIKADYEWHSALPSRVIIKSLPPILVQLVEPKTNVVNGVVNVVVMPTSQADHIANITLKIASKSGVTYVKNLHKTNQTWSTTWNTTELPDGTYLIQAEVETIWGMSITFNLTQIQVKQSVWFKIRTFLYEPTVITFIILIFVFVIWTYTLKENKNNGIK